MIVRAIRFAGYSFALTVVLAGLADSAGMALGGSQADLLLASCIVVLGLGVGLIRPGPCGSLHMASAIALGVAAFVLPTAPRALAMVLLLGMVLPLSIVGRRFGQALAGLGPGAISLPTGVFFGLIAASFGTGPWLYLLMVVGILWPPPAAELQDAEAPSAPAIDRIGLFLISFAAGVLWLSLRPMMTVLDTANVLQNTRRAVTLLLPLVIGWWTLGSALADGKKLRSFGAAVLAVAAALGLRRSALTSDRIAEPEEFAPLVGSERLLEILDRGNQRLTEIDSLYVPWLTIVLAAFPLMAIAAAMRAAAGGSGHESRWPVRFGLMLIGIASGMLAFDRLVLPSMGAQTLQASFAILLLAGAALALAAGRVPGAIAAIAVLLAPWFLAGPPLEPSTGRPFYSLYRYQVPRNAQDEAAQQRTSTSFARVLERDTPGKPGSFQLHDGLNQLTPPADEELSWVNSALLPLLGASAPPQRVLMVGVPHAPTARTLREIGAGEVHLAVDPPELAELAWGFTPEWAGLPFDGLSATASQADGRFDYILIHEGALWDPQRSRTLRPAAIRRAMHKLAPGGRLAIVLDPRRAVPGLTGELAGVLETGDYTKPRVLLVPDSLFTPRIVLTTEAPRDAPLDESARNAFSFVVRRALQDRGLPLQLPVDLELLSCDPSRDESDIFPSLLRGPLPQLATALSATAQFRTEEARPWKRSGRVLGRLGAEGSLPWVYALHEDGQIWSLKDTQVVPREKKVDLSQRSLEGLTELVRQYPGSKLLQNLAEHFGNLAVRKREVEWAYSFLSVAVEEVGWRTPWLLTAYGETLYEMLEAERAEQLADEVLAIDPTFEPAIRLRAVARGEADPFLESREDHEGHAHK